MADFEAAWCIATDNRLLVYAKGFLATVPMTGTITWHGQNWPVWNISAFFLIFQHIHWFSHILFISYSNDNRTNSLVGEHVSARPLGTWIRIPGPPNFVIILFQAFTCSASGKDHHIPPDLKGQVVPDSDPIVQDGGSHIHQELSKSRSQNSPRVVQFNCLLYSQN